MLQAEKNDYSVLLGDIDGSADRGSGRWLRWCITTSSRSGLIMKR